MLTEKTEKIIPYSELLKICHTCSEEELIAYIEEQCVKINYPTYVINGI